MITPIDYTTYEKPSDFYKIKEGKQVIQIVSKGNIIDEYGMNTARGWIRISEEEAKTNPKYANIEPKKRFTWIINANGKIEILQCGMSLGNQIAMLGKQYGDPQNYEIEIDRTGLDKRTTYSVKKLGEEKENTDQKLVDSEKMFLMKKYFL